MLSKLAKNAILAGPVESFCIVCECLLDIREKIHAHLEDASHEEKLASYPHLEKYDGDRIRKIKSIYFCEFCSVVLQTAAKVNVHVTTKEHRDNKGLHLLRSGPDNGVIAFNDVLIKENSWHSVKDECCSICGVEFDQPIKHKKEPSHLLRLVQVKIEFVENGLYRKIDEHTFQCLSCDHEYDINTLNEHFESNAHIQTFENSKLNNNSIKANTLAVENLTEVKQNGDDKKEVSSGARPKDITLDDKEEMKRFAKENRITYNVDHLNAFCRVCEIRMPATLHSMKEHVNGNKHVNKLKIQKPRLTKQSMDVYVDDVTTIQNMWHQDVVINHRICIPLLSFLLVVKNSQRTRCLVCDMNVNEDHMNEHVRIPKHARVMAQSPVVTTFDGEFIREIRPGTFHCGYCNILIPKWDEVDTHLDTTEHKYKRGSCEYRCKEHLPEMMQHEEQQKFGLLLRILQGRFM